VTRLACIFGRHDWTTHVEHGEEYNVCARCGKVPKDPPTADTFTEAQRIADERDIARTKSGG
jgi:hypothetical protein